MHPIVLDPGEEPMRPLIEAKGWGWMLESREDTIARRKAQKSAEAKADLMARLNARLKR